MVNTMSLIGDPPVLPYRQRAKLLQSVLTPFFLSPPFLEDFVATTPGT